MHHALCLCVVIYTCSQRSQRKEVYSTTYSGGALVRQMCCTTADDEKKISRRVSGRASHNFEFVKFGPTCPSRKFLFVLTHRHSTRKIRCVACR